MAEIRGLPAALLALAVALGVLAALLVGGAGSGGVYYGVLVGGVLAASGAVGALVALAARREVDGRG